MQKSIAVCLISVNRIDKKVVSRKAEIVFLFILPVFFLLFIFFHFFSIFPCLFYVFSLSLFSVCQQKCFSKVLLSTHDFCDFRLSYSLDFFEFGPRMALISDLGIFSRKLGSDISIHFEISVKSEVCDVEENLSDCILAFVFSSVLLFCDFF